MPISAFHTDFVDGSYKNERDYIFKFEEFPKLARNPNASLPIQNVLRDPTIGYGYDFTQQPLDQTSAYLLDALGYSTWADAPDSTYNAWLAISRRTGVR